MRACIAAYKAKGHWKLIYSGFLLPFFWAYNEILRQYFLLSMFSWMTIMSYENFKTIKASKGKKDFFS